MPSFPYFLDEGDMAACAIAMRSVHPRRLAVLNRHFPDWAHPGQLPPPGDWRVWVIMAGRGFGKTRAGAEWVLSLVRALRPGLSTSSIPAQEARTAPHIALVAATLDEARRIMVEGPSGILACAQPGEVVRWSPAERRLCFANGAEATVFSGASPNALRGPEHDYAWCDELAKWDRGKDSWDNLQLGLRRGVLPRVLVTTTPQPGTILDQILAQPGTVQSGGHSAHNPHLPPAFLEAVEAMYGGTRLGVQELEGRLLADIEGSLWPRALIERCRGTAPEEMRRTVIGVDPPASANGTCGIVVCALDAAGKAWVLCDASVSGRSPEGWAQAVARAAEMHEVDRIIVEKNQGGDMVEAVLRGACPTLPLMPAHAKDSKAKRAEPVAAMFERGEAFFAGPFPELEAQLAGLVPGGGYQGPSTGSGGLSPDRADAMVWAMTALALKAARPEPRVRIL